MTDITTKNKEIKMGGLISAKWIDPRIFIIILMTMDKITGILIIHFQLRPMVNIVEEY